MDKEIIIISDIWGKKNSGWLNDYYNLLSTNYAVNYIDACELAGVALEPYEEGFLHKQFVDFGIENAVTRFLENQDSTEIIIGCSIGGLIAWKALLKGI